MLDKTNIDLSSLRQELITAWQQEAEVWKAVPYTDDAEAATDHAVAICKQIADLPAASIDDVLTKFIALANIAGEPGHDDALGCAETDLWRSAFRDLRAFGLAPARISSIAA